jgi:hypothetical protein
MVQLVVTKLVQLSPGDLTDLVGESELAGFQFVRRLVEE